MRITFYPSLNYSIFLITLLFLGGSGCGDEGTDGETLLKRRIREAANDGQISVEECKELQSYNKELGALAIKAENWESYLKKKSGKEEGLLVNCTSNDDPPPPPVLCGSQPETIHVYLENSGSMYAYLKTGSTMRQVLLDLARRCGNKDQDYAYYIKNDKTFNIAELPGPNAGKPSNLAKQEHIQDWVTPSKMQDKGSRSSSKLIRLLDEVVQETINDCEPRLVFSDFIYSLQGNQNMDDEMKEVTARIGTVFSEARKANMAVMMIKFSGTFDGTYYPMNSPNRGYHYNGVRPFYAWVVGSPGYLKKFSTDFTIASLRGYQGHTIIGPDLESIPPYTILPYTDQKRLLCEWVPTGKGKVVKELTSCDPDNRSGRPGLRYTLAVDLSKEITPSSYLSEPSNYRIMGGVDTDNWQVVSVTENGEIDKKDNGRLEGKTHTITIEAEDLSERESSLGIELLDKLPDWLIESHTDSDLQTELNNLTDKTFGFRYLTQGVWSAYRSNNNTPIMFTLNITVKR